MYRHSVITHNHTTYPRTRGSASCREEPSTGRARNGRSGESERQTDSRPALPTPACRHPLPQRNFQYIKQERAMSRRRWGGLKSMVVGYLIAQTQGWHVNTETTRPPTSLPADCTRNARSTRTRIRSVDWSGGMLPHQLYTGDLELNVFRHWLLNPAWDADNKTSGHPNDYFCSITASEERGRLQPPKVVTRSDLRPIYVDNSIIVTNKPSGVMSVPGPRRHECVASLAFRYFGKSYETSTNTTRSSCDTWRELSANDEKELDRMIVHRLDRDTSGVLLLARDDVCLRLVQLFSEEYRSTLGYQIHYQTFLINKAATR